MEKKFLMKFLKEHENFISKSLKITGSLVVLGLSSLFFLQNRLIYLPVVEGLPKYSSQNVPGYRLPSDKDLLFEEVSIKTKDNISLYGWFIKQSEPKDCSTVVYFHENAGNLGSRLDFLRYYYHLSQVNILLVAYRGYDKSEGSPSESGLQKDSEAILDYIFSRMDIDKNSVFTHGRSLGGFLLYPEKSCQQ